MFYLPKAALLALAIIYRHDLGLKAVFAYAGIWVIAAIAQITLLHVSAYGFVAAEAILAVIMSLHIKLKKVM